MIQNWSHATLRGTLTLNGIDYHELVDIRGKPVDGLFPRGLQFELTKPAQLKSDKYPVVQQVEYDIQQQTATLHLETNRGRLR